MSSKRKINDAGLRIERSNKNQGPKKEKSFQRGCVVLDSISSAYPLGVVHVFFFFFFFRSLLSHLPFLVNPKKGAVL